MRTCPHKKTEWTSELQGETKVARAGNATVIMAQDITVSLTAYLKK
jgi:hypothetical protein